MKLAIAENKLDSSEQDHNDGLVVAIKKAAKTLSVRKMSYAIPCSSEFRDTVMSLADTRKVNVGDIARSVMLILPANIIEGFRDPGEPRAEDREVVILKSGPSEGKPWRRKPRLQVRMPSGYDILTIRKALGLALELDQGKINVAIEGADSLSLADHLTVKTEENHRLKSIISTLTFDSLPHGVHTHNEALFILGFPPESKPDITMLKARFRMLATVHHPDSGIGSHGRMAQLNEAIAILRKK